uniref:Small ribosomal subunit protein uS11c n=1 Tax=Passiflora obovata TaxID=378248 RepID=A0A4Y5QGR1_9ROSI|nr:ribosomal protein S11 [Passiflora obovata]QCX30689.1 ribosomal protein S11 [Passiflora obovata]
MVKKRVKLITRIPWRKNRRRIRKNARKISKGIFHIQASFNNTIITVTDVRGGVIYWSCAGTCRFKGPRKGTPFTAKTVAADVSQVAMNQGMRRADVLLRGPGLGRDAALRTIRRSGIILNFIRDVTPMPHNGCRPPKKRRT